MSEPISEPLVNSIPTLKAAFKYNAFGWQPLALYPLAADGSTCTCDKGSTCTSEGKHPVGSWTFGRSEVSLRSRWWTWVAQGQEPGVGVLTGPETGLVVIDIDPRHDGDKTWNRLVGTHGDVPVTRHHATGGGGWHFFFAYPKVPIRSSTSRVGPGVDVRADGGLIVMPPTLHASGQRYRPLSQDHLAPMPEWLIEACVSAGRPGDGPSGEHAGVGFDQVAEESVRHSTAVSLAGYLRERAVNLTTATLTVTAWHRERVSDPASYPVEQALSELADVYNRYPAGTRPPDLLDPAAADDPYLSALVVQERTKRHARRLVDAEEAATTMRPVVYCSSVAEELEVPDDGEAYAVDLLCPTDGRVLWLATRKSGKTTGVLNLARAYADGEPFLGRFKTRALEPGRRITWANLELSRDQARRWLRLLGLANPDRVATLPMRGAVVPLIGDVGHRRWVEMLVDLSTEVWILDPQAPLLAASGLDENSNSDWGRLLVAVDRIAAEAGVREVVLVHHTGWAHAKGNERARGASRIEDAVDAVWITGIDEETRRRSFSARGRDVEQPEQMLDYDPTTLRLTLAVHEGSRADTRLQGLKAKVFEAVRLEPGIGVTDLRAAVGARNEDVDRAIQSVQTDGLVVIKNGPKGKREHHPRVPGTTS